MVKKVLLATLLAGCGAQLGDGNGASAVVDGNSGGGGGGGGGGSGSGSGGGGGAADAAVDAPACASGRQLYLNFDGVNLTKATPSDAANNRASWIGANAAIPPWHQGSGTRTADITSIVDGVKMRLASTPITVTTTRPASGPYVMIVFGGQRTADGGTVSTPYSYATNEHDCGDTVKNDVGWISDVPNVTYVPDLVVGAIGWGLGLNGTNDPTDCMCSWANNCSSAAGACTLATSIPSTNSLSPATTCPNQNPQAEVAAFSTGFCAP